MTVDPRCRVLADDFHVAVMIDPQFANDDIVNGGGHFAPAVFVAAVLKLNIGAARWNNLCGIVEEE